MSEAMQTALDLGADDDGLVIIGVPREAQVTQSHSTFRKIDMTPKATKTLSFEWGEIMVMLPRPLYERVLTYITRDDHESRAHALLSLFERGLECSE